MQIIYEKVCAKCLIDKKILSKPKNRKNRNLKNDLNWPTKDLINQNVKKLQNNNFKIESIRT